MPCVPLAAEGRSCEIDVNFYERNKHLFLQVVNDCKAPIKFQNGIPVSDMEGHGIGVQSICAIVQRYGGVFQLCGKGWQVYAQTVIVKECRFDTFFGTIRAFRPH